MNFPVWELEFGGGLLIAVISILHVFVSHFAIGAGLFLVVTEHLAYRRGDSQLERYLQLHSRFLILVSLVFGALSGVGIWFSIGLVSPAATSALIRIFVWGWAIEWVFFLVEIVAAIAYYSTWQRISRARHLALGWIYFGSAYLSLFVINGIITFMLTPGAWLTEGTFGAGFFNPTFWPSLLTRTAICLLLAGVYALCTGVRIRRMETRTWLVRYAGVWAMVAAVAAVPCLLWYHAQLPPGAAELLAGAHPLAARAGAVLLWAGGALLVLLIAPLAIPRQISGAPVFVIMLSALLVFGAFEWLREIARKPYVITDYMYANGLRVADVAGLQASGGLLANAIWVEQHQAAPTAEAGRDVFRLVCRSCHSLDGYNGLRDRLQGLDEDFVDGLVGASEVLRGTMPPFPGTDLERRAVARYLVGQHERNQAMVDGEEVWRKRCGVCHTRSGYRALEESLAGYDAEELVELLDGLPDLDERMPPWSGSERDAQLLARQVLTWYPETDDPEPDGN